MKYDIEILPQNLEAHKDIAVEMLRRKNGLFTFILRVNNKSIVDFVSMEYETYGGSNGSNKPTT